MLPLVLESTKTIGNPTEGGDGTSDIGNSTPIEGGDAETPVDKIVVEEENEEEEEQEDEDEEEQEDEDEGEEDKIVEAEEEETQPTPIDSEKTESIVQHSTEENEDAEALQPLRMFFSPTEYNIPIKLSAKCYISKAVKTLEGLLNPEEMKWFLEHPQFNHFFHMHRDSSHTLMGMWMLLVRMARLEKEKECWFIINGVPVRYSLQEHALLSGLYCHPYPDHYEKAGSSKFVSNHFQVGAKVTYKEVEKKLMSMKKKSPDRLNMAVLYFLCSVIIGKKKTGKEAPSVHSFFLRAVNDLNFCKTFPWGRLAFEENMKDIFHLMSHFNGVVQGAWIFPSFVIPLELLAYEAVPVLKNNFREDVKDTNPDCPRMCKMKFKGFSKPGLIKKMYEKLGTTKDIQSILAPSRREKVLLGRIMEEECGWNDKDDPVADGWRRRLIEKKKSIWFEDLYNQDVATREIEAIAGTEKGNVAEKRPSRKNVARGNLAPENVDSENVWKDRLLDIESRLKIALDDGLQKMNEKIDGLDSRVKSLEAYVNFSRSQGDQRDEQQRDQEQRDFFQRFQQQRDQLLITTGGGEDMEDIENEGHVTSEVVSKEKGDGEGKTDKDLKKKKRKEQGGEPNNKDSKKKKIVGKLVSKKTGEGRKKTGEGRKKTGEGRKKNVGKLVSRSPIVTRQKKA